MHCSYLVIRIASWTPPHLICIVIWLESPEKTRHFSPDRCGLFPQAPNSTTAPFPPTILKQFRPESFEKDNAIRDDDQVVEHLFAHGIVQRHEAVCEPASFLTLSLIVVPFLCPHAMNRATGPNYRP
jgi:hypothetical protein